MVRIYENATECLTANGILNGTPKVDETSLEGAQNEHNDKSELKSSPPNNGHQSGSLKAKLGDKLPQANLDLVEQVRVRLREEYEKNDNAEAIYSKSHYEDLMDSSSPNVCWRYLLQRDQNVDDTLELIKTTLAWRKENKIDTLTSKDMIKDFWLRAPIGFTGRTRNGNELIYAIGKNFRKPDAIVRQTIRNFIAFLIFDWDRKHKHDLDQIELVFDTTDSGFRNIDLDFSHWLVSIRDFVPARIKAIYFVGIPFLIRPVIRLIISWLPDRFRRIVFCGTYEELVSANIDEENIPEEIGGKADNKWRLAPIESKWAHELDSPDANEIFEKICKACNFNISQEYLDKLYKMQLDYEKNHANGLE